MNDNDKKQVFIIGGGPAGSATALSLMNALNIQGRQKLVVRQVCGKKQTRQAIGETIPPVAADYLRKLAVPALDESLSHLPCPGSESIWGDDEPGFNDFYFTPIGQGYHLNRRVFNDELLLQVNKAGVQVMDDTKLTQVSVKDEGFLLELETPQCSIKHQADFIVDATGIQAKVARSLDVVRNQYDSVVSACHVIDLKDAPKKAAHTLVAAVAGGWWYGTQLPNNRALISFCTDVQTLKARGLTHPEQWSQMLLDSGWFYASCCDQFETAIDVPKGIDIRVSPSAILSCVIGANWLAVGDAASSYDSMTSAGITKALQQGHEAGAAIADLYQQNSTDALKAYQNSVFSAFNQYLKLHQQLYHSEQRFPESGFWQRRQFAH